MLRNLAGFLLAPVPAALVQSILIAARPGKGLMAHPVSVFLAICLLIYAFEAVLGVPAVLYLRKRKRIGLGAYAVAGLIVVLVPVLLWLGWAISGAPRPIGATALYGILYAGLYFGLSGLLTGSVFWLISRPGRGSKRLDQVFR
jgi:hypothetical protein